MTINLSAYKTLYLETARKLVEEYARVKSSPIDETTIPTLLRLFHSLKGQSMAMGYKNIALLSLHVETFARALSDNQIGFTVDLRDLLPLPKTFVDDLDSIERTDTELPLAQEIEATEVLLGKVQNKNPYILLVEDDQFFQKVCIDKLKEKSVTVDFSDNGEDAIARLSAKKYDCVLLDIIMPKKNGFDVLQYAKDNGITTPIIVFSTLGQDENVQKAMSMGAADFISKGNFDFDSLMSKIQAVIHKK